MPDVQVDLSVLKPVLGKGLRSRSEIKLKAPPQKPVFKESDFPAPRELVMPQPVMPRAHTVTSSPGVILDPLSGYKPPPMFSGRTATHGTQRNEPGLARSKKGNRGGVSSYVVSPLPAVPTGEVEREALPVPAPASSNVRSNVSSKLPKKVTPINESGSHYKLVTPTKEDIIRAIEGKAPVNRVEPASGR